MQLQVQLDKIEDNLKENNCKARKALIETLMDVVQPVFMVELSLKKGENQN